MPSRITLPPMPSGLPLSHSVDFADSERTGGDTRVMLRPLLALAQAEEIAANPPLSLRYIKEGLAHPNRESPEHLGRWIMKTLNVLFSTADHKEGVASFLEKRAASFGGDLRGSKL